MAFEKYTKKFIKENPYIILDDVNFLTKKILVVLLFSFLVPTFRITANLSPFVWHKSNIFKTVLSLYKIMINRPCVAGAVLQIPPSLSD